MTNTVYEELVDAIKRHMPIQFEQLDDIQNDDEFLKKLLETVDQLPLTFNLSENAERWFNSNSDNYRANKPITEPDGFVSVVPPEPEPEPEPEPVLEVAAPEPIAPGANGEDHATGKQSNWSDEAREKKAEQMRQWRAKKAKKDAAKPTEAAPAEEPKPTRKRLKEAAVEAPVAPEPRGRLPLHQPLVEPEPEVRGRRPLVAKPAAEPIEEVEPAIKKTRGRQRTAGTPTSRMCQVYAELLRNDGIAPAALCQLMNERGIQVAEATVKLAKSTIPNFVEAAKLVGRWAE